MAHRGRALLAATIMSKEVPDASLSRSDGGVDEGVNEEQLDSGGAGIAERNP